MKWSAVVIGVLAVLILLAGMYIEGLLCLIMAELININDTIKKE